MKMLFIFIDGLGLGEPDPGKNPVFAANTPALDRIFADGLVIPTETRMGVPGLPQSATGQTAIFTGVNASRAIGRHLNAQPSQALREIIHRDNLFKMLIREGFTVTNANAYRQEYLDRMNTPGEKRYKPSVTSVMTMSAGVRFRLVDDYRQGEGIYHDITGKIIEESGHGTGTISPREAARRLYTISREHDFTMFEHFLTDIIGHSMDMDAAVREIELLDAFFGGLLDFIDPREDLLFITSDHGNIEDISIKTHTMNEVPTVIYGKLPAGARVWIESLTDITPAVVEIFKKAGSKDRSSDV